MQRRWSGLLLFSVLAGLVGGAYWITRSPAPAAPTSTAVATALGGDDTTGYARAWQPRPLQFPADHGPHPDFRNEWWYFTGNLTAADGRALGYQLTLFRIALTPQPVAADSAWRARELYMGHFALSDVAGGQHVSFERFSRAALDLAGAQAEPFRVWLEDWSARSVSDGALFPLRLRAVEDNTAIDLTLTTDKPLVLQGNQGLSQKSAEAGNASYYYSYTRLPTVGTVTVGGQRFTVTGSSWLDREWSTSALGAEQSGWDWFALQLADGRDLMYYRLRRTDGSVDPHSQGVLVAADGSVTRLTAEAVSVQPQAFWTSPHTGDRYPLRWQLQIPAHNLALTVTARLPDQEMQTSVRYWEGAVSVSGTVAGVGYLEMTRYELP